MNRVKFGDVVLEIKINVDRTTDDHEYFIAGEHMDSCNVHITRRGRFSESDVGPAFIRLFRPGQVLYGSRRTYLRKVAVADFEGITSNTTFVLETKDSNRLLQELLPYIMLTDRFSEYAINNSKGSTNPYILFKDLAAYEFDLPTIEEQRQLVVLLSACDRAKEAYKRLLKQTDEVVKSQFIEMFGAVDGAEYIPLEKCCSSVTGGSTPSMKHEEYYGGDVPFIKSGDVKDAYVSSGALWLTQEALANTTAKLVPSGSVVVVIRSGILKHDLPVAIASNPVVINQDLKAFQPKPEFTSQYLAWAIRSKENDLLSMTRAMTVDNIESQELYSIPVMVAPIGLQNEFAAFVEQSDKSKFELTQAISRIDDMIKALMQG